MNAFLEEIGRQFAARWMALLVLPGLLYQAAFAVAVEAGDHHLPYLWAAERIRDALRHAGLRSESTGGVLLAVLFAAALLIALAAGLAAQAMSGPVERVWNGLWPRWANAPARSLTKWRHTRWTAAHARFLAAPADSASDPSPRPTQHELAAARNQVALVPPRRPTWIGDRLHAADHRIWQEYGLDLTFCWSRLWLVLPDTARQAAHSARDQYARTTLLGSWAILYAALSALWPPALLLGIGVGLVAWRRGRATADSLADLAEALFDVHAVDLATALGVPVDEHRVTPPAGARISERIRKSA